MNYYRARQRKDGRWDFTCKNNKNVYAIGYCHEWHDWSDELRDFDEESYQKHLDSKDKYHSTGHATKEEASNCYRQYLMEHHLHLNRISSVYSPCLVCNELTSKYAEVDLEAFHLCDTHRTKDEVDKLFDSPDEIISS